MHTVIHTLVQPIGKFNAGIMQVIIFGCMMILLKISSDIGNLTDIPVQTLFFSAQRT